MADREKVIKGLEHCSNAQNCSGCPYFCFSAKCQDDMNKDALALLKEQEPIEPDTDSEGTCSCGNCGTIVGYYPVGCNAPEKGCKYCPECGRKVKW